MPASLPTSGVYVTFVLTGNFMLSTTVHEGEQSVIQRTRLAYPLRCRGYLRVPNIRDCTYMWWVQTCKNTCLVRLRVFITAGPVTKLAAALQKQRLHLAMALALSMGQRYVTVLVASVDVGGVR